MLLWVLSSIGKRDARSRLVARPWERCFMACLLARGTCHQAREHLHTVSSFIWKNDNQRCLYHPMKIELANSKKSLMVSFQARSSELKNGIRHHCPPAGEPHFGLTGRWRVVGQSLRSKSFADLLQQRLAKKTSCLKDS